MNRKKRIVVLGLLAVLFLTLFLCTLVPEIDDSAFSVTVEYVNPTGLLPDAVCNGGEIIEAQPYLTFDGVSLAYRVGSEVHIQVYNNENSTLAPTNHYVLSCE